MYIFIIYVIYYIYVMYIYNIIYNIMMVPIYCYLEKNNVKVKYLSDVDWKLLYKDQEQKCKGSCHRLNKCHKLNILKSQLLKLC